MDTKRFLVATLVSALLLIGFEYFMPQPPHKPAVQQTTQQISAPPSQGEPAASSTAAASTGPDPRLAVEGPAVQGSINLRGARFDDLVLRDYQQSITPGSPNVRLLDAINSHQPNFVEVGWMNVAGGQVHVPDSQTVWTASANKLTPETPVVLSWNNGQGVQFEIALTLDRNYMFSVEQRVINKSAQSVSLYPFSRVHRDYLPEETGGYLVHEGPISVIDGRMEENSYKSLRTGSIAPLNQSWTKQGHGGWAGITDKYWLTAVIPDQTDAITASYGYAADQSAGDYQVGFVSSAPEVVAPGATAAMSSHVFAGAKEVRLLEQYEKNLHIPDFWKAVDFGWFAFLTRPIFYVLDWLNTVLGNFGLALMAFTLIVKTLFFPLATRQFHSMGKMRQLQPKMQAIRERLKDDPMAMNQQVMALYRSEKVNPAAGCLPMLLQIPVFWCLYKDLYVTIEMRHAPFFGWIRDLSAPDPTNLFTLFGLIHWNPMAVSPFLALGIWPILFGATMFAMQKLNPTPMDPAQQRIFQLMPLIFTFVMARQPAGLVIYYCWNNLLTALQQKFIQFRMDRKVPPQAEILPPKKRAKG